MRNIVNIFRDFTFILLIPVLISTGGCTSVEEPENTQEIVLNLVPTVNVDATVTRAKPNVFIDSILTSSNGSKEITMGMWLCSKAGSYEPYSAGMNNMKCIYNIATTPRDWTFTYGGEGHKALSVKPLGSGLDDIFLYTYSPYNENATSPEAIPVVFGNDEFIYVSPIQRKSKEAKDTIDIPLEFRHAQACIEFRIKAAHSVLNSISLRNLTISDNNENPVLPMSSEFNIVAGSYNEGKTIVGKSIEFKNLSFNISTTVNDQTRNGILDIPIIPFSGYKDKNFTILFDFITRTCSFQLPAINPDANGFMEFKQGYKYIYNLTIANEMIFESGLITEDWDDTYHKNIDI